MLHALKCCPPDRWAPFSGAALQRGRVRPGSNSLVDLTNGIS